MFFGMFHQRIFSISCWRVMDFCRYFIFNLMSRLKSTVARYSCNKDLLVHIIADELVRLTEEVT